MWNADWRLLLVIPPSFVLTEILVLADVEEISAHDPTRIRSSRFFDWVNRIALLCILFLLLLLPSFLLVRYSKLPLAWNWYRLCLFAGCTLLPWGYVSATTFQRWNRWVLFAFAVLGSGVFLIWPGEGGESARFLLLLSAMLAFVANLFQACRKEGRT